MNKYSLLEKLGIAGILFIFLLSLILLFLNKFSVYIFVPLLPCIMLVWAGRDYRKNQHKNK